MEQPFIPRKTQLCNNFQNGYCYRGHKCNFAHGIEELVTFKEALDMWRMQQQQLTIQIPPRPSVTYKQQCDKRVPVDIETPHTPPQSSPVKLPTKPSQPTQPSQSHTTNATAKDEQKPKQKYIPLYCGNCGSRQQWDFGWFTKERVKRPCDLTPVYKEGGGYLRSTTTDSRGVTKDLIRFTNRNLSRCTVCKKQIMRSPMSAVCVHCNALLGEKWTPDVWHCTNKDGKATKRRFQTIPNPSTEPCKCVAEGSLHGAIAGRLLNIAPDEEYVRYCDGGTGDCYGFVMVH